MKELVATHYPQTPIILEFDLPGVDSNSLLINYKLFSHEHNHSHGVLGFWGELTKRNAMSKAKNISL